MGHAVPGLFMARKSGVASRRSQSLHVVQRSSSSIRQLMMGEIVIDLYFDKNFVFVCRAVLEAFAAFD